MAAEYGQNFFELNGPTEMTDSSDWDQEVCVRDYHLLRRLERNQKYIMLPSHAAQFSKY
jgi:hypothetical protein